MEADPERCVPSIPRWQGHRKHWSARRCTWLNAVFRIKNQPVLFFREILANDLSILDMLDSKWTIATKKLQKVLYGTSVKPARPNNQEQPQRIELPEDSHRGGLLGMSAVLAVSSHPHRTS